jgi:hypothetical protein
LKAVLQQRAVVTARRIAVLVLVLASTAAIMAPSSADAATPLAGLDVIVNRPPVDGLLRLCVTSRSLDPNGTCVEVPANLVPPGVSGLPTVPLISGGLANATVTGPNFVQNNNSIGFEYSGQLTFGGRTFHGSAIGGTVVSALGPTIDIPPFVLTGTSSTDTLSATCSGKWAGTRDELSPLTGAALAFLTCDGSVNGGPPAQTTLLSVYRLTFIDAHNNQYSYDGAFAGL